MVRWIVSELDTIQNGARKMATPISKLGRGIE